MFLQLEHKHKPKQQPIVSQKIQTLSSSKIIKQQESIELPQQFFPGPQPLVERQAYNFNIQGLEQLHKQSLRQLSQVVAKSISDRKRFSEERIYQATVNNASDFVAVHLRDFKIGVKFQVNSMLEGIHSQVEAGIWDGRYEIDQIRKKYLNSENKEKKLISYITGELIKKNLSQFRQQMDDEDDEIEIMDASVTKHAKTQIIKTKKAEQFVNKMREKQAKHLEELSQMLEDKRRKDASDLQQRQIQQQQRKKQKKQLIKRRIERYNELKGIQTQRKQKIQTDYLKMVSSHKKPLFKEMEEKYSKSVLQEQKRKFHILKELKQQKGSLNFDQIEEHRIKYAQLLTQNQQFRQQKKQLKEGQQKIISDHRAYRSKFYSLVMRDTRKIDEKGIKTDLIRRKYDYADYVKNNFVPKIDDKKQQELQGLINRITQKKSNDYSRRYIRQGKYNLQKLHSMIQQHRAKNLLKQSVKPQKISQEKQAKGYINYLEQLKQLKSNDQSQQNNHFQSRMKNKEDDEIRLISKQKEEKAKRKQHFLKSSIQNIDIHAHMKGNTSVEQNYIEAAKAKMALLKKYQLQDTEPQQKMQSL